AAPGPGRAHRKGSRRGPRRRRAAPGTAQPSRRPARPGPRGGAPRVSQLHPEAEVDPDHVQRVAAALVHLRPRDADVVAPVVAACGRSLERAHVALAAHATGDASGGPLLVERLEVAGAAAVDVADAAPVDEVLDLEPPGPPLAGLHPEPGAAGGHHPQAGAPVRRGADGIGGLPVDLPASPPR